MFLKGGWTALPVLLLVGASLTAVAANGNVTVHAQEASWHAAANLASGWNRVEVVSTNNWIHDRGRGPIGAGGNGTIARGDGYPLHDGKAMEGELIARIRESGQMYDLIGHTHFCIVGPGVAEFRMNDNHYRDNAGSIELSIAPVNSCQ
jgi:hypothetical protein